jgi:hypothetical protein
MTTLQESRLNMYLAVRDFLIPNDAITKDLPGFAANFTLLQETITNIQSFGEQQKFDKTGLARLKNELRQKLITLSIDNSRKLIAYANFSGNTLLINQVKFTTSGFVRMTDTGIKDYAQIIYDRAQSNLEALPTYGITADTQKALLDTITAYNDSISRPRIGLTEKSQATKQLILLFDTADIALGNIDLAVEIIRLSQTTFYTGYRTIRKVVTTSAGSLRLKALATDKKNGEPVRGARFAFKLSGENPLSNNGNGEIVKKTAEKGRFRIKSMMSGIYQLLVSKTGYADKAQTVTVADGEMTDLWVEMERV